MTKEQAQIEILQALIRGAEVLLRDTYPQCAKDMVERAGALGVGPDPADEGYIFRDGEWHRP